MSIALRYSNTYSVCNTNFQPVLKAEAAKVFFRLKCLIDYNIKLNALRERNAKKSKEFWGGKAKRVDPKLGLIIPRVDCAHCQATGAMSVKTFQGWKAGRFELDRASWVYTETRLFCDTCSYTSVCRTYPEESGLREVKNVEAFESMRGKFRIVEEVARISDDTHIENLDYAHRQKPLMVRLATAVLTCVLLLIFGWVWTSSSTNTGFAESRKVSPITNISEPEKSGLRKSEQNLIRSVKLE